MSSQKDVMTTRLVLERLVEDKDNQWILESPMMISKTGSPSVSIATNMDIWQRNAEQRKGNGIHKPVSNATERDISPRIVKEKK